VTPAASPAAEPGVGFVNPTLSGHPDRSHPPLASPISGAMPDEREYGVVVPAEADP